jgi:hypothetical protein
MSTDFKFKLVLFLILVFLKLRINCNTTPHTSGSPMHYALFVDSENLPASIAEAVHTAFVKRGDTYEALVYGCSELSPAWQNAIRSKHWQSVKVTRSYGGDQAVDMAISLDMIDTFHTRDNIGIALASGDSDFLPVLMRIRSHGGSVLIITDPAETASTVKREFSSVIVPISKKNKLKNPDIQLFSNAIPENTHVKPQPVQGTNEYINTICLDTFSSYIARTQEPNMPVYQILSALQKADKSFNLKKYGFSGICELVMSVGLFSLSQRKGADPARRWCVTVLKKEKIEAPTEVPQHVDSCML